jgi:hypothetical protein
MGFDASQAFKYSTDFMLAVPSILGVATYQVNLITIINDQVNYDDPTNTRVATSNRITVADGYRDYSSGDGYLNPMVKDANGQTLVLSGGSIVDMEVILGPLVFPYYENNFAGGLDSGLFYPLLNTANNVQVFIQLMGPGLNEVNGNFFKVKEVVLNAMSNIYFKLRLTGTSVVIPNIVEGPVIPNGL